MQTSSRANFIPLDQALTLISRALHGADASLPEKGTDEFRAVWQVFRHALQDPDVEAVWFNDKIELKRLPSSWAAAEFFNMDNHDKERAHLCGPNQPVRVEVSWKDLDRFLHEQGICNPKKFVSAETQCGKWLEQIFGNPDEDRSKDDLFIEAKSQFPGLSRASFERVRKDAIRATGRTDLKRAGRRREVTPDPK